MNAPGDDIQRQDDEDYTRPFGAPDDWEDPRPEAIHSLHPSTYAHWDPRYSTTRWQRLKRWVRGKLRR